MSMTAKEMYDRWAKTFGPVRECDPTAIAHQANLAAAKFVGRWPREVDLSGTAYQSVQPRNGYEYLVVLHDIAAGQQKLDDAKGIEPTPGPPTRFGGNLLVAVTNFHRCTVLNLGGYHTPDYINEKFDLGYQHSVPLAVFLTVFDDQVCILRAEDAARGST